METQLLQLVVPILASLLIAGLKYIQPKLHDKVPGFMWPFAAFGLNYLGSAVCSIASVPCSGSPFGWSDPTVAALSGAFVSIALHQGGKAFKDAVPKLKELLDKVGSAGTE